MPPIPGTNPSIKLSFTIPYRGGLKDWSMKMHFSGGTPANDAAWTTFGAALYTELEPAIRNDCFLTQLDGYTEDGTPAVFTATHHTAGTFDPSAFDPQAAYMAALLYWTTDARNSRGGPIYLRNFVHGAAADPADLDAVASTQLTALEAFAARFDDAGAGFSDGTNTYKRCGPRGAVGLVGSARPFLSHRVLARRG